MMLLKLALSCVSARLTRSFSVVVLSTAFVFAEQPTDWVFVGPESPSERINAVAGDGDGRFVAVGDNGVVHWSPNGDDWIYRPIRGLHGNVTDVLFEEGLWILVTDRGEVGVSENGRVWGMKAFAEASFAKVVSFGGVFYAIGKNSLALSADGENWDLSGNPLIPNLGEVVEATVVGSKMVVVGVSHITSIDSTLSVYSSSDASVWEESSTWALQNDIDSFRFAGIEGMAVVTYNWKDLYASRDMVNWERVYDPTIEDADLGNAGTLEHAFTYNDRIVLFVRPSITVDGVTRPSVTGAYVSLDAEAVFRDEAYVNPIDKGDRGGLPLTEPTFVAGGRVFVGSDLGSLYGSEDLTDWTKLFEGRTDNLLGVAVNEGRLAAVSEYGEIITSDNAIQWVRSNLVPKAESYSISSGSGHFLVAGGELESAYRPNKYPSEADLFYLNRFNQLSYSVDGETWSTVIVGEDSGGVFSAPSPSSFHAFVSGDGTTLAISIDGNIYRSRDFENWETLTTDFPSPKDPCVDCDTNALWGMGSRLALELYYDRGEFWARSVEYTVYTSTVSHAYDVWYRSVDDGETWVLESDGAPSFVDPLLLEDIPSVEPGGADSHSSGDYRTDSLYAFGRYVKVGEDYRIELSETVDSAVCTRLVNLSLRAFAGDGNSTLIAGFVASSLSSGAEGNILLRGVGPSLQEIAPTLADQLAPNPRMLLYHGKELIDENEDSSIDNARDVFDSVGAFRLLPNSGDAALLRSFGGGIFTAHVNDSAGGIALAEIYRMPDAEIELKNLSGRAFVSKGDMTCIGGFVLEGETVRSILIRGVGEGLGIGGELADPLIALYRGSELVAVNDDWSGVILEDFFDRVGAFPLEAGSRDAAMAFPLLPGAYTVHLAAKEGDSGIALLEIYDLGD